MLQAFLFHCIQSYILHCWFLDMLYTPLHHLVLLTSIAQQMSASAKKSTSPSRFPAVPSGMRHACVVLARLHQWGQVRAFWL